MKKILGSAGAISACIFLSRILGFVRDMLCTGFFGVTWDAFIFAFTIPNLFRRLFGEGALSAAFIPTFSQYLHNKTHAESLRFINIVITILLGSLTLIAALVIAGTYLLPALIPSLADRPFITIFFKLLRIMIPYMPLICLVALLQAILNSFKHFLMPALASVVLNICWIGGFVLAARMDITDEQKVTVIAWAILIGGVMEVVIQIPALLARKINYRPAVDFNNPGFREVLRLMGPTVFGLAVFQINLMVDYIIAKAFITEPGAISALYFGNRLMQFPFALIGISLATVIFPFLAECVAKNDIKGMANQFKHSIALILFVSIPASIGLIILSKPLIYWAFYILPQSLFHIKSFTESDIHRTAVVLGWYSAGIWAYSLVQLTNRAFYSMKDMKTPVRIGVYMVIVNLILNLIMVRFFREGGIALATTISAILNLVILLKILGTRLNDCTPDIKRGDLLAHLTKSFILPLVMSLGMGVICYVLTGAIIQTDNAVNETIRIIILVGGGAVCYIVLSLIFQRQLLREIFRKG